MPPKIYFVVPEISDEVVRLLQSADPSPEAMNPDCGPLCNVQWAWIIQTFLYMKQAGLDVDLVDHLVDDAICVLHYETFRSVSWGANSFIVGVRADNPPIHMREIEIVQSPVNMSAPNTFLMDHWPQSRIIPRAASRENRIERISYFGGPGGLSPQYTRPNIQSALETMGVTLNLCVETTKWSNYEDTDLVLAVRDHHHPFLINTKPASKLVNTWIAGCVALLGNEPTYRAVGQPGENYFEIDSPEEMLQVVRRLKESPDLYQRIRAAGVSKAPEYGFKAVQKKWVELLSGPVIEAYTDWKAERIMLSRRTKRYFQFVHQWTDHKLFKIPVRSQEFVKRLKAQ